jgi:uncharacterized repeat protein (TIGR01451 family)
VPRFALLSIAAVLLLAAPAGADTINVQNRNDSGNGSLRQAIADADPNDEIVIPPGTYKLTSGELDVGLNLTLIGAGAGAAGGTAITAGGKSRVFNIHDGEVTLKDLRITGGRANPGAGIQASSTTNLERVVVAGNVAPGTSGAGGEGKGGGVFTSGPELNLLDSSVTGNRAGGGVANGIGGGIKVLLGDNASPTITLTRSTVSGNTAGGDGRSGYGGGIDTSGEGTNTELDMTLTQSTVSGNVAGSGGIEAYGGGIEAGSGNNVGNLKITLDRSTISGNRTAVAGGAAGIDYQSGGNNVDQSLTVTNSTIAGNTAASGTAGIAFVSAGSGSTASGLLKHVTLFGNSGLGLQGADAFTVQNSILANNTGGNCDGPVGGHAGNVESANSCGFTVGNDKPSTDPKLKPLGDYGGPTRTMLPRADSPAIGNANSGLCLATDQRDVTRPQGTGCDSGAVEAQIADVALTVTRSPKSVSAGKVVTYTFSVKNKGPQLAQGVILRDTLPGKLKLVSFKGCSGKPAGGCVLGNVPVGTTRTVTIRARALRAGRVVNRGRITSFAADPNGGNDAAAIPVTILPSVTGLTMNPKSFPVGGTTTIRLNLSDPGQVSLTFALKGADGKFHKALVRKFAGKRGKNKYTFAGGQSLSPGRYRLSARVTDSGGRRSKAAKLGFKITS